MSEAVEPMDSSNRSVTKALRLLREIGGRSHGSATVTTLAKTVGISRTSAFRLLQSMERAGFVDRIDNSYVLGWEMARLGRLADPYSGMAVKAQPPLQDLADSINETASLAVPDGRGGLELIAAVDGTHFIGSSSNMVGRRYPLHASSIGKVFLADMSTDQVISMLPEKLEAYTQETLTDRGVLLKELDKIREQGFAISDNELEREFLSLSRPVRDSSGSLVAILSLYGPRFRFGQAQIAHALQKMQSTVDQLIEALWEDTPA